MAAPVTHSALEVFAKLPPVLARFFRRYPPVPVQTYARKPTFTNSPDRNPFLVAVHPVTKRTHEPKISLRRQADLFKMAEQFGLEKALPYMNKKFGVVKQKSKKKMRGVVRPKLKKHERTAAERAAKRAKGISEINQALLKAKGKRYQRKLEKRSLPPKNLF